MKKNKIIAWVFSVLFGLTAISYMTERREILAGFLFLVLGLFINPKLDKRFQIKGICILKKIKQATSIIMVLVIGLVLASCRPLDDISDTTIASFSDDTKTYTEMRDDDKTNTQTEKREAHTDNNIIDAGGVDTTSVVAERNLTEEVLEEEIQTTKEEKTETRITTEQKTERKTEITTTEITTLEETEEQTEAETEETQEEETEEPTTEKHTYEWVLNTSRKKIHYPSCSSVKQIADHNYATSDASVEELEEMGYSKCGRCF